MNRIFFQKNVKDYFIGLQQIKKKSKSQNNLWCISNLIYIKDMRSRLKTQNEITSSIKLDTKNWFLISQMFQQRIISCHFQL